MKREEAIQVLQTALTSPFIYGEYAEALDMAIEALSADTVATIQTGQTYGKSAYIKELAEVVRCKDCRWYEPKYKDKEYDCPQGLYAVYGDDYCSHGERREP